MESVKIAFRSIIMLGTLVVGALAYKAYGPQIDSMGTRLHNLATDLLERGHSLPVEPFVPATALALPPLDPPAEQLAEVAAPPPLFDEHVQPASGEIARVATPSSGIPAAEPAARSTVSEVVEELQQRGVREYSLVPWGSAGEFYRFQCSAAWGTGGRYVQQFEAIADDPAAAAAQVLQQVAMRQDTSAPAGAGER